MVFFVRNLVIMVLMAMLPFGLIAQDNSVSPSEIITGTFLGETPPLRDLPVVTEAEWQLKTEKAELKILNPKIRVRSFPYEADALPRGNDQAWQKEMGANRETRAPIQMFNGQDSPYYPPDANGTIGPNHYMHTINTVYTIYDRAGAIVAGPTNVNTLFYGLSGANYNDGDPIVLYDEQADRWLVAEFSITGANDYMLIAVSTTNDPTGTWYKYSFDVGETPDYEKIGIWQDGYYMGTNTYTTADIYVFERSQMLNGQPPQGIGFDNPWRPGPSNVFNCVPPLDNDGVFAPEGEPGLFIAFNDDAVGGGTDALWVYELDVDWDTLSNSTFSRTQQLAVTAFDSNFGATWSNIAQLGTTTKLDAVPQVIMNPPQYRNFGTYETILCCHTVDVDNTDHAGVRWYELRRVASGPWTIRQQGTYAPDGHSRWMASIMLNGSGEIGLGYSISSSTLYPGIRYCGQSATAYATGNSTLDVAEEIIQTGTYSQTATYRWGDYSAMQVDPTDDETFWYTNQYAGASSARKTKIANFQIGTVILTSNFAVSNPNPQTYSTVTFTDISFGSPTGWNWTISPSSYNFIEGTSSSSQNPKVQFTNNGYYTISLTVTNGGNNDSETKTDFVSVSDCGFLYLPFNVDFADSTLPGCWKNIDNFGLGQTWVFDNPANRPVNTASDSNGFALLDSYMYGPGYTQNADLITPILDLSAYTTVNFSFQHWFYYKTPSSGKLYHSINGGATWILDTTWASTTDNPAIYSKNISSYAAGQSNVRFKWNYTGTYGLIWAIDDISITGTGPNLWTGATSGDWATATNWSAGTVPTGTSNVFIPWTATNWPTITGDFTLGTSCNKITLYGTSQLNVTGNVIIPAGKTLAFNGNGTINIAGNWINEGGYLTPGDGTVKFSGSNPAAINSINSYQRSTFTVGMTDLVSPTNGPSGDDKNTTDINLGFTFNYYGTDYTQVQICTNGWLAFDLNPSTTPDNTLVYSATTPNNILAPWFDDLNDDNTGSVNYKMDGTAPYRVFTAEWKQINTYKSKPGARINFQVKLFETTNIIEFHYGGLTGTGHDAAETASIGIEDAIGGSGHFMEATTGSTTTGITNLVSTSQWPTANYRFSPYLASQTFYNITIDKSSSSLALIPDIVIKGNLDITNGTVAAPSSSAGTLNIHGNFSNNGTFTPGSGTVLFSGTGYQTIGGGNSTTFTNLTINNGAEVTLQNNEKVSGLLTMAAGNIICGSFTLELGTSATATGTLNWTSGNISGNFKRWIAASTATPIDFPVGTASDNHNARVTFSNNTAGSLTAKFEPGDPGNNTGFPLTENSQTLNLSDLYTEGTWTLVPAALTSTNYTLELSGTGFTSAGTPGAELRILKRPDGGGDWAFNGTHATVSPPVAKRTGLSGFSRFALAQPSLGSTISGSLKYYNQNNTPLLSGITVKLYQDGSQVGTDFNVTNGSYTFSGLEAGLYEMRVTSSNSTEGSINSTDAAQTNYWGAIPYEIEKVRFYAGDVTGGTYYINSTDALLIQGNFVSGASFDKGSWAFWKMGETINSNSSPSASYATVNLGSNDMTVDIYGLCAGDFNRSFVPGVARTSGRSLELVYSGSQPAESFQEIELPVYLKNSADVGALSLILDFPSDLAEVQDVVMDNSGGRFDWSIKENQLRIGWNSMNPIHLNPGDELLVMKLKTKPSFTPGSTIRISLADDPRNELADSYYEPIPGAVLITGTIESAQTGLQDPAVPVNLELNAYPNPFSNFTLITFNLPFEGKVGLEITNILGNSTILLIDEILSSGKHSVYFDANKLPEGLYLATLKLRSDKTLLFRSIRLISHK